MSPMRPPQPIFAPSGPSACQVDCWSLCEPSACGRGFEFEVYSALVSGTTSGPALARMASRPAPNRLCTSAITGCSAKVKALFSGETVNLGAIGSTPPSRAGEARGAPLFGAVPGASSAIESGAGLRSRVYSANEAVSVRSTMFDESLPP